MSKKAIEKLRMIWKELKFATVGKTIVNPKDIINITVYENESCVPLKMYSRIEEVPDDAWKNAAVSYSKFYGFAQGILFHGNDHNALDIEVNTTLDFSSWWNHKFLGQPPGKGTIIAGQIVGTPKGKKFTRWFVCTPELKLLIEMVLSGKAKYSETELAEKLITIGYPDTLWAIARLLFFDDVQAFVDELKERCPAHPLKGRVYYRWGQYRLEVSWNGMYLSKNVAQFVHELSFNLDEPMWWEEFQKLAKEQELPHSHPAPGGLCRACLHEREKLRQKSGLAPLQR